MSKIIRFSLGVAVVLLAMYACNISGPTATPADFSGDVPAVGLTMQVVNASTVFNTVGQTINYSYVVTNIGNSALAGPVTVADSKTIVICPEVNTVGDKDADLDQTESVTCTSSYNITQADLNTGSVTNNATAKVGGVTSNTANAAVNMTANKVLTITTTANPTTYSQSGQNITFTYVVKNTGTTSLGPTQFVVRDERIGTLINCDVPNKTLAANETVTCTATTTITQNDMNAGSITSRASASGGGAMTIETVSITVTNTSGGTPSSSFTPGATIKHEVKAGEWMLQIARCYGADFNAVKNANPQVIDPNKIWPLVDTLTVPNIGSNGKIYGPPCVVPHTVQSGDTWNSIAQKYNADVAVLMEANKNVSLTNGTKLKIPINSAGGTQPTPQPGSEPIRVTFPTGSTSVTIAGAVNASSTIRYVVNATAGQTLNIKVTPSANEVALGVNSPSNAVLKQLDTTLTWSGTITVNGDHFINVASIAGTASKTFQMEVSLNTTVVSPVERVADINVGAGDSNPSYLWVFNGSLYFRADGNDGTGAELWKYDIASNKPSRVSDVNLGTGSSEPAFLKDYNGALYFRANGNDGGGTELWRFNGSATGRLTDINSGIGDSNPSHLAVFNNLLYFSANGNDGFGVELWKTDGTAASRVADIHSGTGDSNPSYLVVYNNALYFSALSSDGVGVELYKYDGTNITRISDINVGVGNSNPAYMTVFNNILYFSANGNDGFGTELWKYDGTTVSRAADINVGAGDSAPAYLTVFNNNLYFSANGNDGTGFELWRFNGTNAGRVADINKTGDSNPSFLTVFNNELYFQANGGDGAGKELWKFKGP